MSVQVLLTEVQNSLARIANLTSNYTNRSQGYDVFEGFIFCLVLEAAIEQGASITYRNLNNNCFVFRTSPGYIAHNSYSYAEIEFPNKNLLEAHLGVYVEGISGVKHECDVVVLRSTEAETCRRSNSNTALPHSRASIIAIECKFYTTHLKTSLAREFLGLGIDLGRNPEHFFVTNIQSQPIERLLGSRSTNRGSNIFPTNRDEVDLLRKLFRAQFRKFVNKRN
jgi:hypothetical protein